MNANELINKIEKIQNNKENIDWYVLQFVVPTLRQQQSEIESLKENLKRYADAIGEERGNKALRNNEIGKILTKVLDDCGLLKKAREK